MRKLLRITLFLLLALSSVQAVSQVLDVTVTSLNACAGSSNGSITITVDNTTTTAAPYNYFIFGLSNGSGPFVGSLTKGVATTISNLPVDSYIVNVSDNSPAVPNFTTFANVTDVSPGISFSSAAVVVNNSNCTTPDGKITISPTGGSGSYIYSWTGPGAFSANTQNLTGLAGGSYTVTIGDSNANCSFTSTAIIVTDPLPNAFAITTPDNTLCNGDNLVVNLNAPAPEGGVTYTLEVDGTLTSVFAGSSISYPGLALGAHTIRVKAALGSCTPIYNTAPDLSVTVSNPATASVLSGTATICSSSSTNLKVTITGGTGPFTVVYSDGSTNTTVNNYASGSNISVSPATTTSYSLVSVIDANGCASTGLSGSAIVTVNQAPTASVLSGTATICQGNSANLKVTITGGTGPYSIVYSDGTTNSTVNSYVSGSNIPISPASTRTYSLVSVTDANGCLSAGLSGTATVTVGIPATASVISGTATICSGTSTNLSVTITGGTGPFTVVYSDGSTNSTVNNYASGSNISVSPASTKTYALVSVTDALGCPSAGLSGSAVVTVNQAPTASALSGTATVCQGNSTNLKVTITGGTGPFTVVYSDGSTNTTLNNYVSASNIPVSPSSTKTYSLVSVTDANGCPSAGLSGTATVTVGIPATASVISGTATICSGSSTNLVVTITGGTGPFTVVYSDGSTNSTVNNYASGSAIPVSPASTKTYTLVSVTDALGCPSAGLSGSAVVTVNPSATSSVLSGTGTVCSGTSTNLKVTITGGTGPFTVVYSDGSTNTTINNYASGSNILVSPASTTTYSLVSVTDANGCASAGLSGSAVVTVNQAATSSVISGTATICRGSSTNLVVTITGGTGPFKVVYSNGASNTTVNNYNSGANIPVSPNVTRTFTLVSVTDANGCLSTGLSGSAVVTVNPSPTASVLSGTATICSGTSTNLKVTITSGTGPFTVVYSDGSTNTTLNNYASGSNIPVSPTSTKTYSLVSVTDANGCASAGLSGSAVVTVNQAATASVLSGTATICSGSSANLVVTITGGTGPFTVVFNDGSTNSTVNNYASGSNISVSPVSTKTYTLVSVTDANGCTSSGLSGSAVVTVNQAATASVLSGTATICSGSSTNLVVTITGGTGPFTVVYSDGSTNSTVNNYASGSNIPVSPTSTKTYTLVSVTDASGCASAGLSGSAVVTVNPSSTASVLSGTATICSGSSTNLVVTITGGTGPFTVVYSDGSTNSTVNNYASGSNISVSPLSNTTYTLVSVTDANGCASAGLSGNAVVTVNTAATPSVTIAANPGSNICSGTSVTFTATPTNGGAAPTYQWKKNGSNVGVGVSYTDAALANGDQISVVMTTSLTCVTTATATSNTITMTVNTVTFTDVKTDVTCNGLNDGTITVTGSGGSGSYTYSKDNGVTFQASNIFNGLAPATYKIVVKDGSGCISASSDVTISQPAAVTFSTIQTNVTCNAGSDGKITVTASGGNGSYSYSNDNGATYQASNVFSGLIAATYQVVVKDGNGCLSSPASVTITAPTAVTFTFTSVDATCNGASTGSITVTASGGSGSGYVYSKDNGATFQASNVFNGLLAGTYSVVAKDGDGCASSSTSVTINQPTAVTGSTSSTDVTCNGGSNGSITVTGSGGSGTYTYSDDNGVTFQASSVFNGLIAGSYSIVVKDGSGCLSTATPVTINQPTAITFTTSKTDVTTCTPGNDGSITIASPTGGSGAGYTYSIDNGTTFQAGTTFNSLTAGNYNVVVKDGPGCVSAASSVTVGSPGGLSFATSQSNVSCNGSSDGSITITPVGGSGTYTYSKDNGATFGGSGSPFTFSSLPAGTYQLVVKDGNNCQFSASVTITEPAVLSFSTTQTDATCNAASDGTITVTAAGGTSPYQYSKDNGTTFQASNSLTGLVAGSYSILVKDANGCTTSATSVTINQPTAVTSSTVTTDVACNGGNNGSITVTGSGGSGTYTYSNDNGATFQASNVFNGLIAGSYNIVVKDGAGCLSTATLVTINQPTAITFTTSKTDVTTCTPGNDGSITIASPAGGSGAGYTYSIDNGTTFQAGTTFNSLTAGNYNVFVKDGAGCVSAASSVAVGSPGGLSFTTSQSNVSCNGSSDGSITITPVGGSGTYTYSKDNGATFGGSGSSFTYSSLTVGTYQLVVKDGNGCQFSSSVTITEPNVLSFTAAQTDVTCNGNSDGTITITASGGTSPYQYSKDGGITYQAGNSFSSLASGSYNIVVKDSKNCVTAPSSVTINQPVVLSFTTSKVDATSCLVSDGQIAVTASGGTMAYQYSKDNGATYQPSNVFLGLSPGSYQVMVKDANSCVTSASTVTINAPGGLTFTTNKTDATCNGASDGTITIAVSGGTSPYQYSKDNGATFQASNVFSSLAAATHQLVAKDVNGCQFSASVAVGQPSAVTFTTTKVDAGCSGGATGSITITASGGNNLYTYSIDNGANYQASNTFISLSAQAYQVLVKDGNNCLSSAGTVTINAGNLTPSFVKNDATCAANDGTITVNNVIGGVSPYQYSIDGGTTYQAVNTFTNLNVGNYSLVIKDNSGCISSATAISIGKPGICGGTNCGAYTVSVVDTRPTCAGQDDGTITISVSGGSPNYIVTLSDASQGFNQALVGPGPSFKFINLSPSLTYQYTINDQAGNICTQPYSLPIQTNVQATASNFVDAKCFNQPVGQATVTVTSGGTSPYEYSLDAGTTWVSFTSPVTITNLMPAAAPYAILVRDGASDLCPAQVSVTINNPAAGDMSIVANATDATCAGNDGKIDVTSVTGGTAPYTYKMDGSSTTNLSFTGLNGGPHTFTVTDANACSKDFSITVNFPGLVLFTELALNATCAGIGRDGLISVNLTSVGTFDVGITTDPVNEPTTYVRTVSAGGTDVVPPFSGLARGTYYVVAKPVGALCPTRHQVTISGGPDAVDFDFVTQDIICFEDKGGVRLFGIKGSSAVDYKYQISNTQGIVQTGTITQFQVIDTVNILGFSPGVYTIKLFQDQSAISGCSSPISSTNKPFALTGPSASLDTLFVNKTISLPDRGTGAMLVGIAETTQEPYQVRLDSIPVTGGDILKIDWTNAVRNPQNLIVEFNFMNLYVSAYKLWIRDGLGCTKAFDIEIPKDTNLFIPNVFTPNGDNHNDTFFIRNLPDNSKTTITITNRWGNEVFSSSDYKDHWWNGGAESDGVYYYRLAIGSQVLNGWVEIMRGTK